MSCLITSRETKTMDTGRNGERGGVEDRKRERERERGGGGVKERDSLFVGWLVA